MVTNTESILVHVGLDRLGDGLLKLPFAQGLRAAYPNARITWLAGKDTSVYASTLKPLVAGVIDEVIERGGVGIRPGELFTARPLAGQRFDLVIDTQRIFWISLQARRIRHRQFASPAAKFWLSDFRPKSGYRHPKAMQRQLLDLLELVAGREFPTPAALQIAIPEAHRDAAAAFLPAGPRYVALAPGSGGRPKCWPLERFIAIAESLVAAGAVPVFLIGPQETEWAAKVFARLPAAMLPLQDPALSQRFGFDPRMTIALSERMSAAVSNDSGIAHMLAIGGAPLVALYGPTVYEKFPPMTERIAVVRAADFGGKEMSAIPVDAVNRALAALSRT